MKQTVKVTTTETRELPDFFVCNVIVNGHSYHWYGVINNMLVSVTMFDDYVNVTRDLIDEDTKLSEYDLSEGVTEITSKEFKAVLARAIAIINAE